MRWLIRDGLLDGGGVDPVELDGSGEVALVLVAGHDAAEKPARAAACHPRGEMSYAVPSAFSSRFSAGNTAKSPSMWWK